MPLDPQTMALLQAQSQFGQAQRPANTAGGPMPAGAQIQPMGGSNPMMLALALRKLMQGQQQGGGVDPRAGIGPPGQNTPPGMPE